MNELGSATIAAVAYIMDHLGALPADRGRCEWFFYDVPVAFTDVVITTERRRMAEPSEN